MKPEVILIIGFPAAGKTSLLEEYPSDKYIRLNRDSLGGTLKGLAKKFLQISVQDPTKNFVLDNTYSTCASREEIIRLAKQGGYTVKCIWLQTSLEDAQFNACVRMYRKYGRLLEPDELKRSKDPNTFPPMVQYKFRKEFEEPSKAEGFDEIIPQAFSRKQGSLYVNKGLGLDYDGTIRETISGDIYPVSPGDIRLKEGVREKLDSYIGAGYTLFGVSNQSGVQKGYLTYEQAKACFEKTNELLGLDIPAFFCPHNSNPISCYCRKPMPGHGVKAIEDFKLDRSQTLMVGDMTSDATFAGRCGFKFVHADKFF